VSFCTAVNCMDGRVQRPVIDYLCAFFKTDHVDMITEPAPVRVLASDPKSEQSASIYHRIDLSIEVHHSNGIAVVAHHDCARNPTSKERQLQDLRKSAAGLRSRYPDVPVVALWIDDEWSVRSITDW
jgi:hypothetical protein